MSKDKISDYSATANSNTDIGGINIDEGCAPSGINDAIRTLMKQLKDWQSGSQDVYIHPAGSASVPSITATGDTNTGLFFPAADTVGITTGGTERARVDSSGNLGLGVTPSAWNSSSKVLQLNSSSGGTGSIEEYVGQVISLNQNGYRNSSASWVYVSNNYATQYYQYNGQHVWQTAASGTAGNTITFTQAMTLDASGNLGIGTTSPQAKLHVSNGSTQNIEISPTYIQSFNRGGSPGYADLNLYASNFIFNNGNLLVGTTSKLSGSVTGLEVDGSDWVTTFRATNASGGGLCSFMQRTSSTGEFIAFRYGGGTGSGVGLISTNGTTTTYSTSSDYRLKENIAPMTGALAKVAALKPCTYRWKADGSAGEGFIAHELAEVVPEAVAGEKDAVNEDGSIKPQGIDTSFLVATLTAAIQELNAKFEAYKAAHP